MIDYSKNADYNMWLKTNYPAQKEQIKAAGLNPALLYGMSGGGGATIGGGAPSVTGSGAANPNSAAAATTGMGIMNQAQLALLDAQKKNIDANTAKTVAETPNVEKTGKNIEASTQSILQGINNLS